MLLPTQPYRTFFLLTFLLIGWSNTLSAQNFGTATLWVQLRADTNLIDCSCEVADVRLLQSTVPLSKLTVQFQPPALIGEPSEGDSAQVTVTPLNFPKLDFYNKDSTLILNANDPNFAPYVVESDYRSFEDDQGLLNKSGSLSRGIVVGNNQDLSVNSALNLQLSGKITNDVNVLASISDDNLPIQPDGNTQQLQDFDQVYVKLYNERASLIAGDFQVRETKDHFIRFQKRARGALLNTSFANQHSPEDSIGFQLGLALSKGKFARNIIQGIEGNQGPYRLTGAENELFIIVLAGTERVYIDGQLLQRGRDYDYIIDYNSAEVVFMPSRRITKDRRIVVEFQYSDRNYARTMIQTSASGKEGKISWGIQAYSEQDSKNQPLQQTLNGDERRILSDAGDDLLSAFRSGIDSVGFDAGLVLYELVDTLGYDSVLRLSTSADAALYTAAFSFVGAGNGNYIEEDFTANGRTFKWVAPDTLNGVRTFNGSYEPIRLLVTPKQKQLLSGNLRYDYKEQSYLQVSAALSKEDLNTFSEEGSDDDTGIGAFIEWNNEKALKKEWVLASNVKHEYISQYFSPIERFRGVEFDRNWNIRNIELPTDQHVSGLSLGLKKAQHSLFNVFGESFLAGSAFSGYRGGAQIKRVREKSELQYTGSLTQTEGEQSTNFYRHKSKWVQKFGKLAVDYIDDFESNESGNPEDVLARGYRFYEWKTSLGNKDSTKNQWNVFYSRRWDEFKDSTALSRAAEAEEFGGYLALNQLKAQKIKLRASQRTLNILRNDLIDQEPDKSLLGRIEHSLTLGRGALQSNLFYEIGSGLEQRREFIYLEVPAGQGAYVWNDYNEDGVRDLSEFEIAPFAYEANFIRSWVPSNQYVRTFSNQFSETLVLQPARIWSNEAGIKKTLSKFSNTAAYRIERKTSEEENLDRFNPFLRRIDDQALISLLHSFRNTLVFNRSGSVFGMNYTYQEQRNKNLLANGFESRSDQFHEVGFRWNLGKGVSLLVNNKAGVKRTLSDFLSGRNYVINYQSVLPELQWQPSTKLRLGLKGRYTQKNNDQDFGGERSEIKDLGVELKSSDPGKGLIQMEFHWVNIQYAGSTNSALSYEMLEALQVGNNLTWTASLQRTLGKNLQLNLNYNGRTSAESPTIHTGGIQVRAFF